MTTCLSTPGGHSHATPLPLHFLTRVLLSCSLFPFCSSHSFLNTCSSLPFTLQFFISFQFYYFLIPLSTLIIFYPLILSPHSFHSVSYSVLFSLNTLFLILIYLHVPFHLPYFSCFLSFHSTRSLSWFYVNSRNLFSITYSSLLGSSLLLFFFLQLIFFLPKPLPYASSLIDPLFTVVIPSRIICSLFAFELFQLLTLLHLSIFF